MNIQEKLMNIQQELKAPKNQRNNFGNYNYRSLEDIDEAVKPLLKKNKCCLVVSDDIINFGDRYYIKATARLIDVEADESLECSAMAREALTQKGMQDSQLTGSTSSYARKYCLNGLFCIDDTKDADHPPKEMNTPKKQSEPVKNTFLDKMKGYAKNEPDIYWKVLGSNGFEKATDVNTISLQNRILKEMEDSLKESA